MARATGYLERGHAPAAVELLTPMLEASLKKDDELAIRSTIAEALLMMGDLSRASAALGRPPDTFRDPVSPVLVSTLWRLHGRVAFGRGEQSRAIGRAHYELALCYKQVGDATIVREHITEAAAALHAAGDRRHLAQVHALSGTMLAQTGRYDEATAALRQAERQATTLSADDVLATVCGNQAIVAMLRNKYDQAYALAERAVTLQE